MTTYTEEEAKTKWCPYARVRSSHVQGGSFNREVHTSNLDSSKCIAFRCMAWRWGPPKQQGPYVNDDKSGYCGLVGKP